MIGTTLPSIPEDISYGSRDTSTVLSEFKEEKIKYSTQPSHSNLTNTIRKREVYTPSRQYTEYTPSDRPKDIELPTMISYISEGKRKIPKPISQTSSIFDIPKRPKKKKIVLSLSEFQQQAQHENDQYPECKSLLVYGNRTNAVAGFAKGEKLEKNNIFTYLDLVSNWRLKFMNTWKSDFVLDGLKWNSVQNYLEYKKFYKYPEYAKQFSLDSGSELGKNPMMAKAAGSWNGTYKGEYIRPPYVKYKKVRHKDYSQHLALATYAKFTQSNHMRILLEDTRNACLFENKVDPTRRAWHLERTRDCLFVIRSLGVKPPQLNSSDL